MDILDCTIGSNEAAMISGYSPSYIKNACAAGKIKSKKIGTSWVIDKRLFSMKKEGSNDFTFLNSIVKNINFAITHNVNVSDAVDKYMRPYQLSEEEQIIVLESIKICDSL